MTNFSITARAVVARSLPVLLPAWLAAAAALAGEPPVPARSHLQPVSEIAHVPVSGEALGIRLSRASAVLRQQLALRRGAGLVVDEVRPGTRAAAAGFEQHDVLVRLEDQLLVLPQQFDALLEASACDEPLTCTVLRAGREVAIPLAGGSGGVRTASDVRAESQVPPAVRRPLRPTPSSVALVQPARPADAAAEAAGRLRRLADETLLRQDDDFEIRLSRGDRTRLLVRDPAGMIVFDGPVESAADRDKLPAAIRGRVAEMERLLEPRTAAHEQPASRPVAEIGRLEITPVDLH